MEKNQFRNAIRFNNVKEIIYNSVKLYPENVAFEIKIQNQDKENKNDFKYVDVTYKKLLEDVNCFGTSLYKMGLNDKKVAVIGKNRYEWVVAHLANLLGDMVSVPLDKDLQTDELEASLIRSEAEAIVFDTKQLEKIEKIKAESKTNIKYYICMDEISEYINMPQLLIEGKKYIDSGYKEYIDKKIDSKKMGILLFTSGTTSLAKAVMLSQYAVATNIYDMQLVESFYDNDVNIAFLPFHHIFGSTCIIMMLANGVKTVFLDGLKYIKKNLKEYKVSVFVGVPILISKMYQSIEKEINEKNKMNIFKFMLKLSNILLKFNIDIRKKVFKDVINGLGGHIRFVISGGAPLDPEVYDKFNRLGIHMVQGYGLTETSPVIAAENDKYMKKNSVGIPMKNVEVKIIDKDENKIGQIMVKGPSVMLGYYKDEQKTNEVIKDGWFNTGDLGYIDQDGFLFVTGRSKDMIVLKNGKKIFPEELELLVNKIQGVKESFVYAKPRDKKDSDFMLSAEIVYDPKVIEKMYPNVSKQELKNIMWDKIKKLNARFPKYKHIKDVIVTSEELIKTTTQKIKRDKELEKIQNMHLN